MAWANRLLVVDDEPSIRELVERVARDRGFGVATAAGPAEFASVLRSFRPDVVVLDLVMPGGDGIELLRFLANEGCGASVLLMSGADSKVLDTAGRLGATRGLCMAGRLRKPFPAQVLGDALVAAANLGTRARKRNGTSHEPRAAFDPAVFSRSPSPGDGRIAPQELRTAIGNDELLLHYQPIVAMASGEVIGVEALVRWHHPRRGLIMPNGFIPLAEESGLIGPLTRRVLDLALRQCRAWKESGTDVSVAVNLSAQSLSELAFPDRIAELLQEHGVAAGRLAFEITEREATADPVRTMDVLVRLRLMGIELAVDDFGTGHSSLAELHRMPFTKIKIDKSFVFDVPGDKGAETIVRSVIGLGRDLGLTTVAEGVENEAVWTLVASLGCDMAQGYYVGRPVGGREMTRWLGRRCKSTDLSS